MGRWVSVTTFNTSHETLAFTRNREKIGQALVDYGGSTAFPGRELIDTCGPYLDRPTHLVIITDMAIRDSDQAIKDMGEALKKAGGGGVLYFIPRHMDYVSDRTLDQVRAVGYHVVRVAQEEDLRNLSTEHAKDLYGAGSAIGGGLLDNMGYLQWLMRRNRG